MPSVWSPNTGSALEKQVAAAEPDLKIRFLIAANAAKDAGDKIVMKYFRRLNLDMVQKADESLQTIADRESDR